MTTSTGYLFRFFLNVKLIQMQMLCKSPCLYTVNCIEFNIKLLFAVGFDDYDYDDGVLARVIAESRQEYLASLKKNVAASASTDELPAAVAYHDSQHGPDLCSTSGSAVSDGGKGKSIMPKDSRH